MRKVLAVLMAAALVGCGNADGDGGLSIEEPPPKDPGFEVTDSVGVQEEIIAAWRGYGAALDEVNADAPDPDHPLLAQHATGAALERVRAFAQRNRDEGIVTALPEGSISREWPELVSVAGQTAQVRSCEIDDRLIIETGTGEVLDDKVVTLLTEATLVVEDGRWKVSEATFIDESEGVSGCALEHQ